MQKDLDSFHSANVSIKLDCGEHGLVELSRVTPTSVYIARPVPADIPPCQADLVVIVDGQEMRRRVDIAEGLTRACQNVMALPIDQVAPF